MAELASSIRIEGVLQPIVVRYESARDVYIIVHGERRWRASREAGLVSIPAIVREVPEERRLVQQLMENIVRDDLNALDRAAALRALKNQLGDVPWEQVAEAVGIRRSRLFQLLGTEKLPDWIQEDIRAGRLSEKQSRALQGLPEPHQSALRSAILEEQLTAEEASQIARRLRSERVPHDEISAAEAIRRFRAPAAPITPANDELATLLATVAGAASGDTAQRNELKRLADRLDIPRFEADRIRSEVLTLAGIPRSHPEKELRPGSPTFSVLVALYGALDALLATDAS